MVDFAYHVHTDVGNQMFGAKVNGKAVHAGHALANAEVVEVLTYDGRPSKGSIARHQVRCIFCLHSDSPEDEACQGDSATHVYICGA